MTKASKVNKNPPSPKKARRAPSMREKLKNRNEKAVPTIRVNGFQEPVAIEVYDYTITSTKPGFVNK